MPWNHQSYQAMPLLQTLPRPLRACRTMSNLRPSMTGLVVFLITSPFLARWSCFCSSNIPIPFLSWGFCICWSLCLGHFFPGSQGTDFLLLLRSQAACHLLREAVLDQPVWSIPPPQPRSLSTCQFMNLTGLITTQEFSLFIIKFCFSC